MVNIDERLQEFHMTHSDSYNICTSDEENVILYSYFIIFFHVKSFHEYNFHSVYIM